MHLGGASGRGCHTKMQGASYYFLALLLIKPKFHKLSRKVYVALDGHTPLFNMLSVACSGWKSGQIYKRVLSENDCELYTQHSALVVSTGLTLAAITLILAETAPATLATIIAQPLEQIFTIDSDIHLFAILVISRSIKLSLLDLSLVFLVSLLACTIQFSAFLSPRLVAVFLIWCLI